MDFIAPPDREGFCFKKEGALMKQLQFLETLEKLTIKYYNRQLIYDKDEREWCHWEKIITRLHQKLLQSLRTL